MNFLKKIFKRPIAVCMIVLASLVFGVLATMNMSTNLLPDISFPALGITVAYPGASAEKCDEDVRPLMENSLKTLSEVKSLGSYCIEHATIMTVMFDYGTDLDKKIEEIKDKFALVTFPSGCYDPIFMQIDFNGMAIATVAVKNETDSNLVYEDADELKDRLLAIKNVGSVSVVGVPEKHIEITPIKGLEITTLLIIQALTVNSQLDIPLGTLEENGETVAYRNESSEETIEDIKNTPFQMPLTRELGDALNTASKLLTFVQNTSSIEMQELRDSLKAVYDFTLNIDVPTGAEMLEKIESIIPFDDLIELLNTYELQTLANAIEEMLGYLRENPDVLNLLASEITSAQEELSIAFTEENWAQFDSIIEFKKEHEFENPITGEIVPDELTNADYITLIDNIDIPIPMKLTEDLIGFIRARDFSALTYDADGNANLNLYVSDIATVKETISYSSKSYLDGDESVTLLVYGISGANTTEIAESVKGVINNGSDLKNGSELVLLDDQSQFINDSIHNVLESMLIGGALAVIVIFLFLFKVRTSLIIAITMPVSVLCSLILLSALGLTLNMVSLGGMAVGIGMLVDNSIVVIESISFERDKGKTAFQAAVDGTKLVAGSLLASTLTSICVFFPILFTEGLTKMIFTDMSWSVIFSLSFSLLVALTVIPTLYCAVYKDRKMLTGSLFKFSKKKTAQGEETRSKFEEVAENTKKLHFMSFVMARLMHWYEKVLRLSLSRRWLVILIAFVLFISSIGLAFATGTEFLPSVDQRTIELKITFDVSDKLDYCEETSLEIYDDILSNVDGIKNLSVTVGKIAFADTSNVCTIRALLEENGKATSEVAEEMRQIASKYPFNCSVTEVDGVLASLMSSVGGISDISVNVVGDDIEVLKEISSKVREKTLSSSEYFKSVDDNLSEKTLEYLIKIDKMKCIENGIDYTVAVATLRAGIAGYNACSAEINGETVDVNVTFEGDSIKDYYGGLENFILGYSGNTAVALKDVAEITPTYSYSLIKKEGGKNLVTLSADAVNIDSGTASKQFVKIVEEVLSEYDGYEFEESGVNYYLSEVFDGLIVAIIISFFLLFTVMACQFESLLKPFIVIFAIPFSFTGGFLALSITGITLNVVSFVGLIMLMGVIVNDAIVMIDRIGQLTEDGLSPYEAVIEGSKNRMRAIWMTTLTTILALIPLALAIGKGAELMQPLAVVVIGGMTLGTVVTLILIPVIYSIINRVKIPKEQNAPKGNANELALEEVALSTTEEN